MTSKIVGNHHITLSTGGAQEDWDFHTQALGLRPVKKTMLYDGAEPVYHLYYSNADIDAGVDPDVVSDAPAGQGRPPRLQPGQGGRASRSTSRSIDYWANRLDELGFADGALRGARHQAPHVRPPVRDPVHARRHDRRHAPRLRRAAACPRSTAIKGAYAPVISVIDPDEMVLYLETGLGAEKVDEDGARQAFELDGEGFGRRVELLHEPDVRPGTWHFAEGTPHHWAWNVVNEDNQMELKGFIEGLGFTDVTEQKDRGYFLSVYNRTPGGALFEYAFTPADRGFLIDEPEEQLGDDDPDPAAVRAPRRRDDRLPRADRGPPLRRAENSNEARTGERASLSSSTRRTVAG